MKIILRPDQIEDYRLFLKIKGLPRFSIRRNIADVPDEYMESLGLNPPVATGGDYVPIPGLFDYQRAIAALAIRKRKFAAFVGCGLGKTLVLLEYMRHVVSVLPPERCALIVSPLMVVRQTIAEARRWYGDSLPIEQLEASQLPFWLTCGEGRLGITNYEAVRDNVKPGRLGALGLDEASLLKSHYGRWGTRLIKWGKGLDWKLCLTGTPAPNDRIEFANHAVFLDQEPNVNAFLARYFINRGETQNRWEMKGHALRPFYTALSHWSIFLENPATYGWQDNAGGMPPIITHIHDVDLTEEQSDLAIRSGGDMFGTPGGITSRLTLARLAKGHHKGKRIKTNKTEFIRDLIEGWPDESTIVWTKYNDEHDQVAAMLPGCGNITGTTPQHERERIIEAFQSGAIRVLVSKPKILGLGLNLQRATRQVFSTCQDSYEEYHQAVKRSNRVGSTRPLNVHLPITALERPMLETVLRKAARVDHDTAEQEAIFKECRF